MRLTLKARLTVWHVSTIALVLALVAGGVDWWLSRAVETQIDAALVALAETEAASALDSGPPGELLVHLHDLGGAAGGPTLRRLDKLVQVVDSGGDVVVRGATLGNAVLPSPPELLARLGRGEMVVETLPEFGGEPVRLVSLPIEVEGRFRYALQVATSLSPARAFVRSARLLFVLASCLILVAVVVTGRVLTTRALAPVDRVVSQARTIGASTLRDRLPHPSTSDELGRLVSTLNDMLDRLEHGFDVQRRFTADAAHELRSPLSRLRTELEVTLRRPRDAAEYETVLRSCLDDVERLGRLTEDLLTLARLDAGEGRDVAHAASAVNAVIDDTLGHRAGTADKRGIRLVRDLGSEDCRASVAPGLLALVVGNLVDNAVKFSPPGGAVTVTTRRHGADVVLTVADTGPGIPPDEARRVFDRFYRGHAAGSPDTEGVGLGLAIVRTIVEAHGGAVTGASRGDGPGACFTVTLPAAR